MIFLNRADFEYAATQAGITDLVHEGEDYANAHTQAAYAVWKSVAFPLGDKSSIPLAWVNRRGGKAVGIVLSRPTGPESPSWPKRRALGWEPSMPMHANVPGVSAEVMAVIRELQRQRQEEGYSVESDIEQYQGGELARAAACYAMQAAGVYPMRFASFWPFKSKMKTCLPAESLTKAVALILAEVERAKAQGSAR
jgi:hypothetical protein